MKALIITNNPKVYDEFSSFLDTEYHENMPQEEILKLARDRIHLGAKLVIHPMMGRIRPHETPYKSVFLEIPEGEEAAETDLTSVQVIEDSMAETRKFLENTYMKKYDESLLEDLAYIDLLLIRTGADEYGR